MFLWKLHAFKMVDDGKIRERIIKVIDRLLDVALCIIVD